MVPERVRATGVGRAAGGFMAAGEQLPQLHLLLSLPFSLPFWDSPLWSIMGLSQSPPTFILLFQPLSPSRSDGCVLSPLVCGGRGPPCLLAPFPYEARTVGGRVLDLTHMHSDLLVYSSIKRPLVLDIVQTC